MSEVKVNKISPRTNCGTTQLGDAGDTITVTGDLKSNSIKSASGSTLTLGQSGDTVTLASGASQSGFGRTGTVDWDTTAKTASFTAVSGNGYFVNTTSGAITVTLPASPSAADIVAVSDYANTSNTNNITIGRNSSNIEGSASDFTINNNGASVTFVYVDATKGWKVVNTGDKDDPLSPTFLSATGGTVTTCGDFKIHTFTGPGTFCVSSLSNSTPLNEVSYVVLAGGGGGSADNAVPQGGAGGGAGGFRESKSGCDTYTASPIEGATNITVTATAFPITVGGGGAGSPARGSAGSNSVFSTITSAGGGEGGVYSGNSGCAGGSGGGGGANGGNGGAGNTPPVTPPQGNPGSNSQGPGTPGAGGGAGGAGSGITGGVGVTTSITGSATAYAGGGANGTSGGCNGSPCGTGGDRYGNGTANRGAGGGGGCNPTGGGDGSSGIVIIRYKYQ
jgi:hypothetical protein